MLTIIEELFFCLPNHTQQTNIQILQIMKIKIFSDFGYTKYRRLHMKYTISISDNEKFWQVFGDGVVLTSFKTQEEAEYWCSENDITYKIK